NHRRIGGVGLQNTIEDHRNDLDEQALGCADDRHQDDGRQQRRRVRPGKTQQAVKLFQACASSRLRSRSSAAIARETGMCWRPSGATIDRKSVCHGPQMAGFDGPNRTTLGTPKAAAMCAGPLSFPTNSVAFEMSAFTRSSGSRKTWYSKNGLASSPGPARNTGSTFQSLR